MEQNCVDLISGTIVLKAMLHRKVTFLQQKVSPVKNVITFYPNNHVKKMLNSSEPKKCAHPRQLTNTEVNSTRNMHQ